MSSVTIRELRNRGGTVVDRAARGEQITITRAGKPVAKIHAIDASALSADVLLARWRGLPSVDAASLRRDLDDVLSAEL